MIEIGAVSAVNLVDLLVLITWVIVFGDLFYHSRKPYFLLLVFGWLALFLANFTRFLFLWGGDDLFYSLWAILTAIAIYLMMMAIRVFFWQHPPRYFRYVMVAGLLFSSLVTIHFLLGSDGILLICAGVDIFMFSWMLFVAAKDRVVFHQLGTHSYIMTLIALVYMFGFVVFLASSMVLFGTIILLIDILLVPLQVFIGLYFVVIDHDLTHTLKTSLTDKYSHDIGNAHQSILFVLEFLLTLPLDEELQGITLLGQKELKKANELLSEIRNL